MEWEGPLNRQGGVSGSFSVALPKGHLPVSLEWAHLASNQGPTGYEPVALPTELWAQGKHPSRTAPPGSPGIHLSKKVFSLLLRLG